MDTGVRLAAITGLILVVDSVWLTLIGAAFGRMIRRVQGRPMRVNKLGAAVAYAALVMLVDTFVIAPCASPMHAFALGAGVYGVYEGTSMALLDGWSVPLALADTLWGGVLVATVALVMERAAPCEARRSEN